MIAIPPLPPVLAIAS
jgi:hypothetical protein